MRKARKVLGSILFYVALVAVIGGAAFFALNADPKKSIGGYRFYEVLSGSMEPTIHKGELVIVKLTDPQSMKKGDIVTRAATEDGSVTVTHRIIEIEHDEKGQLAFRTKGDNSPAADAFSNESAMIGTVVSHIPYVGYGVGFIKHNLYFTVALSVALIVLFASIRVLLQKPPTEEVDPEELERKAASLEEEARHLRAHASELREKQTQETVRVSTTTPIV